MRTTMFLVAMLAAVAYGAEVGQKKAWELCTSSQDCAPGLCCTLSYERYSTPVCRPMQQDGEVCRPGGPVRADGGSRFYPDQSQLLLGSEVYMMFCPCAPGLGCDRDSMECRAEAVTANELADEPSGHKDD